MGRNVLWAERGLKNLAKQVFKSGTIVRSHYGAPWTGEVVRETERSTRKNRIYVIRVTHDRTGQPMRRTEEHELSAGWLEEVKPA